MTLEEAKNILRAEISKNGNLFCNSPYIAYGKGEEAVTLDGDFTADELEAIAVFMRGSDEQTK